MKETISLYSLKASEGYPPSNAVCEFKELGLSIAESMKMLFQCYKMPLATAKQFVCSHPSWVEQGQLTDQLHEDLLNEVANENNLKSD
jgi:hypothetical protein